MEANDKIAAVHKYVEAFAKADMDIIREIYAVNARVEDPVGTEPHEGIDAICAFYEGALASGAKLALTGEPRCAGNAVAFPFQAQTAGFTLDIIDVFEFDEQGKVNSMKAYWGAENMKS
jgi:steroid delta-isomerase